MSNGAGNGELVQVLLNILGEMRTLRLEYEEQWKAHEGKMAGWQAEHDQRMAEHDQRMAEHDQRMAEHDQRMEEWAVIMARINAQMRDLDERLARTRDDFRVLGQEQVENRADHLRLWQAQAKVAESQERLRQDLDRAREDHALLQKETRELAEVVRTITERVQVMEGTDKALVDAMREVTLNVRTLAAEVSALKNRVDVLEGRDR